MAMTNVESFSKQVKPIKASTALSWLVWSLGCLFYFYEFLLQVSPGVMKAQLSQDFAITAEGFGVLGGVYFYAYSSMQIPAGLLLDKLGPHRLLTAACSICALSTLMFAHSSSFSVALVARFAIGIGSSFAAVGAMKLAANWFPAKRFALLTGLMVAIGMAGAIGGEKPLALLVDTFGWRMSLNYLGLTGIVLALLIYAIAQDSPNIKSLSSSQTSWLDGFKEIGQSLKKVLVNKQLWIVATYGGLMFMPTLVFCGLWGVPFLESKYNIETEHAATLVSMVFVGWILGGPSWGLISDKLSQRKPPMIIGTIGAFVCLTTVLYLPNMTYWLIGTSLLLFGFFSAGFLPAFSIAKEISCQKNCATALSFMNMMNMIGAALVQPLVGKFIDYQWVNDPSHHMIDSTHRFYTPVYYEYALVLLPIGLLLALLFLPFIRETFCQTTE